MVPNPALPDVVRWTVVILFAAVLAVAAVSDIRSRRIPNWTVLAVAALFACWVSAGPSVSIASSLAAAAIVIVLTGALYYFNLLGAGDSKLMTAVALFAGLGHLVEFVFLTVVAGGMLALVAIAMRPLQTLATIQMRGAPLSDRGIPYGVAIAIAGVITVASMCFGVHWPLMP